MKSLCTFEGGVNRQSLNLLLKLSFVSFYVSDMNGLINVISLCINFIFFFFLIYLVYSLQNIQTQVLSACSTHQGEKNAKAEQIILECISFSWANNNAVYYNSITRIDIL